MLRWLLAICLLSAAHTRVIIGPRELELGWPFGDPNTTASTHKASDFAPLLRSLPDQCMLWDSSCSGNKTEALDEFFSNNGTMFGLVYRAWEYYEVNRKLSGIPPENNSKIRSWMRDPDCRSSFLEWHTENPDQSIWTYTDRAENTDVLSTMDWSSVASTSGNAGCCDICELVGGNVDVYYWPVPGANTDCLASVGTTAASDIDQNLMIPDVRGVGGGWWKSQPNPYSLTSFPSSSSPALQYTLNARGHAILSAPGKDSEAGNVVTQNGFTFTSPSIYVNFSSMWAADRCGPIGTYIPYTMLTFAPGELSTIEMPVWDRKNIPRNATKSFNFADLPCPPSSIMIADQYKPAPGSPYRPVLSPPQQIFGLQFGWSGCTITHAFEGIDPPRSLVPAAALVPNLTPTSPQSHGTETTPTSSLKPVSGAVEAGSTGVTRDPPATPAHNVQTAGPRSTTSPSSPSTANNDPLKPKTSLDPHVKTDPRVSKWQPPISPEAVSKTHTSPEKAKDSSIQGSSKDRSFTSLANTEASEILSDAFQSSRVSPDQKSDISSTLSPNPVVSNSLPTYEELHEEGASIPLTATTQNPSSDHDRGQNHISSNLKTLPSHVSLPQEGKYTQGTTTAEPGSPQPETLSDNDIPTRNRNPPGQTKGNPNGPFTHIIIADPSAEPASVTDLARNPDVRYSIGSSTHATLQSSPYDPLPNEQGEQQSQASSRSSFPDGDFTSIDMPASKPSLEAKPDHLTSATSTRPSMILQTESDPLNPASLIAFKRPPELKLDPLIHSPASTDIHPTNSSSGSGTHEASAHANTMLSKQSSYVTADHLPSLSIPSSDLHSVAAAADSNTLGHPQIGPSNSMQAVAPSFTSKGFRGDTTTLPFKNGEEGKTVSCFISLLFCFGSIFLLFLV